MKQMRKKKILIVDDSEMNRDILTGMLEDEYEIVEAEDGEKSHRDHEGRTLWFFYRASGYHDAKTGRFWGFTRDAGAKLVERTSSYYHIRRDIQRIYRTGV